MNAMNHLLNLIQEFPEESPIFKSKCGHYLSSIILKNDGVMNFLNLFLENESEGINFINL